LQSYKIGCHLGRFIYNDVLYCWSAVFKVPILEWENIQIFFLFILIVTKKAQDFIDLMTHYFKVQKFWR